MSKKVTVIGAGNVGAECARSIVQKSLADVVLLDIVPGVPQGKALDLTQAGSINGYNTKIIGTNDYADTKDADIAIITAGLARKPGMSRDDLQKMNAGIIKACVENTIKHSPNCILLIVTNPLDTMTYWAHKLSGFPANRVLGMAPLLDAARMAAFIAMELNVDVTEVKTAVMGTHGDLMVPVPSQTFVSGKPVASLITKDKLDTIIKRTQDGGAEIVNLLKTGSAYYAPAAAAAHMAEAIIKDKKEIIYSSVMANGQYGLKDLYIGLPAKLGKNGVENIVEIQLTSQETAALHRSAQAIKENNDKL